MTLRHTCWVVWRPLTGPRVREDQTLSRFTADASGNVGGEGQ